MAENSQISNDQVSIIDKDASVVSELEMAPLPRNDRQRFFEVVQYQHDILKNFRESEVSYKSGTTDYWIFRKLLYPWRGYINLDTLRVIVELGTSEH